MAQKRVILELGTGNDLHGGDYTKAALRAVQDALHPASLTMRRALRVNSKTDLFGTVRNLPARLGDAQLMVWKRPTKR